MIAPAAGVAAQLATSSTVTPAIGATFSSVSGANVACAALSSSSIAAGCARLSAH